VAESTKPNILVIWGDDIGITNLSCSSDGLMGYRTPNIDCIANEGMRFTDAYGEQSCTAGQRRRGTLEKMAEAASGAHD
jgi:arylsulfatase